MAFNFNGNVPTKIVYNGNNVNTLIYNGVTVWQYHVHTSACYHTHTDSCYAEDNYAECGNCGRTEGDWAIGEECSCGGTFGEAVHRYLVCNIPEGTKTCGYE